MESACFIEDESCSRDSIACYSQVQVYFIFFFIPITEKFIEKSQMFYRVYRKPMMMIMMIMMVVAGTYNALTTEGESQSDNIEREFESRTPVVQSVVDHVSGRLDSDAPW